MMITDPSRQNILLKYTKEKLFLGLSFEFSKQYDIFSMENALLEFELFS